MPFLAKIGWGLVVTNTQKAEVIFRQAVAYAAGAMAIDQVLTPNRTFNNFEPLPYIMNLSFAIELFMKALLRCEGKDCRGHKYLSLFNKLSSSNQRALFLAYKKKRRRNNMSQDEFKNEISSINNTFARWRYVYESANIALAMERLVAFANATMDANIEKQPTWKCYGKLVSRAKNT